MTASSAQSLASASLPGYSRSGCSCAAEIQKLQDRIEELETLLGLVSEAKFRPAGLTKTEWQFVGLVLKHKIISEEVAFRAIYAGRADVDHPGSNIIHQTASRTGRKLAKFGIKLMAQAREGWYLSVKDKSRLRALIDEANSI